MTRTRGRPVIGESVIVGQGLRLVLEARGESGSWIVRPLPDPESADPLATALALLERHGQNPLPPYIRRGREGPGDRLATRRSTPADPGRPRHRRPGYTSSAEVLERLTREGSPALTSRSMSASARSGPIEADRWKTTSCTPSGPNCPPRRFSTGGDTATGGTDRGRRHHLGPDPRDRGRCRGSLQPFAGETRSSSGPGMSSAASTP